MKVTGERVSTPEGGFKPTWERHVAAYAAAAELLPGQTRKETEGVFVIRSGTVEYVPIKMGIAGDRYFEDASSVDFRQGVVYGLKTLAACARLQLHRSGLLRSRKFAP